MLMASALLACCLWIPAGPAAAAPAPTEPAAAEADPAVQAAIAEQLKDVTITMQGDEALIETADGQSITVKLDPAFGYAKYAVLGILGIAILSSLIRLAAAVKEFVRR